MSFGVSVSLLPAVAGDYDLAGTYSVKHVFWVAVLHSLSGVVAPIPMWFIEHLPRKCIAVLGGLLSDESSINIECSEFKTTVVEKYGKN